MDAIDALICFGFKIEKRTCTGKYMLICRDTFCPDSVEFEAIASLYKEYEKYPEYNNNLIQQKGAALGT